MRREDLLSSIASQAYSVGYGAKLHYATIEMAAKIPGWINLTSLGIGVFALVFQRLNNPALAATLVVAGIATLYFNGYQERIAEYDVVGKSLTDNFWALRDLMNRAASAPDGDLPAIATQLEALRAQTSGVSIARHVFLASWYAHYKFFWQSEIAWISAHREPRFRFWRDKMPLGATVVLVVALLVVIVYALSKLADFGACL